VLFWQPDTTTGFDNSTVDISSHWGDSTYKFASMGINYSGTTTISLDLGWTPFYQKTTTDDSYTLDTSITCDYTLGLDLKGDSSLYTWSSSDAETEDAFVNGYHVKYTKKRLVESKTADELGSATTEDGINTVADLYVTELNTEKASSGEFISYLICYITAD